MTILHIFGLLAIATFTMALAARTCTLWKLGLVFLFNWILSTIINFNVEVLALKASLYSCIDFISLAICFNVFRKYKCITGLIYSIIFLIMTVVHLFIVFFEIKGWIHILLNVLFITQSLVLIFASIRRMTSRNERNIDIGPRGHENRRSYVTKSRRHYKNEKVDYV